VGVQVAVEVTRHEGPTPENHQIRLPPFVKGKRVEGGGPILDVDRRSECPSLNH
jgi:hypothetical protein